MFNALRILWMNIGFRLADWKRRRVIPGDKLVDRIGEFSPKSWDAHK